MIEEKIKYGVKVWVDSEMDELRRERCLCLNCRILNDCDTAKNLYEICKTQDMAMMITRCKYYIL
jgi:hypothetical protein